ncbi:hypothetical protein KP509_15G002900 [Ceratopteris richardii]|uniref:ARM repeat N-terminal plant domain-containing protein n=1 Tax=Ceratopteris richardii TaxID=49495 RepID=A0A8T2T0N2_CERRI|nr:hypothetical protein KP509_15G002900 [Ceratopteris richardii]
MEAHPLHCIDSSCLSCLLKEPDLEKRHSLLTGYFSRLPSQKNAGHMFAMTGLWSLAISQPNNVELVETGVFGCMAALIWKGMRDRRWLLQHQNIFVPYFAAHVIGSYTMNREDFAEIAVKEGVIPPLIELLRGRLTWVEQRVAVRALGHLAAFNSTFLSLAVHPEVLELAMELASCSLEIVYTHFVQSEDKRLQYHRDLLTVREKNVPARGNIHIENQKAEEWASQLQCWSLQLINCFAFKEKYIANICRPSFLTRLPDMWGGLVNDNSPAGVGLLRTICQHKVGRSAVAAAPSVVHALTRIARSSDDWQYLAAECLLLLLQDARTRQQVMDLAAVALADLAELPSTMSSGYSSKRLGKEIIETLLQDDTQSPLAFLRCSLSEKSREALDELASLFARAGWEKRIPKHERLSKEHLALNLKLDGNARFAAGDVMGAALKFTEALSVCPIRAKNERIVLYSNRAQCHLLMEDAEAAISDATRALCLARPPKSHGKSLWRRAQAYEMLGFFKESLMDAIMFANECTRAAQEGAVLLNKPQVPDYAEEMVNYLMKEAWLFKDAAVKLGRMSNQNNDFQEEVAGAEPVSPVSSSLPSTATRGTMAPSKRDPFTREGTASSPESDWSTSSDDLLSIVPDDAAPEIQRPPAAAINHSQIHQQTHNQRRTQDDAELAQSKFTPRSRLFLHSKACAENSSPQRGEPSIVLPKRASSPLLPTTIRGEIDKQIQQQQQQQAGQSRGLDSQLLKKTLYELLHNDFSLDRSRSSSGAGRVHFPARDDASYIAR